MIYHENNAPYLGESEYFVLSYRNRRAKTDLGDWCAVVLGLTGVLHALFFLSGSFIGIRGLYFVCGFWFGYFALTLVVNKKAIWVKNNMLSVVHAPLPFFTRNNNINLSSIKKAEVYVRSSRFGPAYDVGLRLSNDNVVTFSVASNLKEAEYIVGKVNQVLDNRI